MKRTIVAGSALAALVVAAPLHAQLVRADVVVRAGPVRGHVVINDRHSTYRHRPVVVREQPARVIVVERFRGHGHHRHWKRRGYRPVVVYVIGDRYYERYHTGARKVVVYERKGRYYQGCDDCRPRHRRDRDHRSHDRYRDRDDHRDRDRGWDHDRDRDRGRDHKRGRDHDRGRDRDRHDRRSR